MNFNQTNKNAGDVNNNLADVRLTVREGEVLKLLNKSLAVYFDLTDSRTTDTTEFVEAVNAAKKVIALRVVRRADPEVWS